MNQSLSVIQTAVEYIEEHLTQALSSRALAGQFYLSEYHFNRMFKAATGASPKQYILGRKLTRALEKLEQSDAPVIDLAYEFGFEYPEVFSRAFKKQFGLSPRAYRQRRPTVQTIPKAEIIERQLVNYQGGWVARARFLQLGALHLAGARVEANPERAGFRAALENAGREMDRRTTGFAQFRQDCFYSVVNCHGDDSGEYTVFTGREALTHPHTLAERVIPAGWYACFDYQGDMFDVRAAFVDDMYRWLLLKDVQLENNGVGMVAIFSADYPRDPNIQILFPIQAVPTQQKAS